MANRIFDTILKRKIESFVATFVDDSESIFFNEKQLIHPGEFGKYRENAIKDLLRMLTSYKISDGFIISSSDSVSTQCDIIIYDDAGLPILENNHSNFFTIESVIAIGEVKSTLSYSDFKKALIKIAKNAMLFEEMKGIIKRKERGNEHNTPITFLICKNISFKIEKINFEEIYKGIDRKYWYQSILVLELGIFNYRFSFNKLKEPDKTIFQKNFVNNDSSACFERSSLTLREIEYDCEFNLRKIDENSKFYHIMMFLAGLTQAMSYKTLYETHIISYSSLDSAKIFKR